jgi:hypothetical protein
MVWFVCREETCRRVGSVERGGTGGLKAQDKAQSTKHTQTPWHLSSRTRRETKTQEARQRGEKRRRIISPCLAVDKN